MSVLPSDDAPRGAQPRTPAAGSDNPTTELPRPEHAAVRDQSTNEPTGEDLEVMAPDPGRAADAVEPAAPQPGQVSPATADSPIPVAAATDARVAAPPRLQE